MRTPTAVVEGADTTILVAIEDLVAGLPRDPELGAQRRHLLALKQAGDKPEPLVHDVTLLPRHAPSCDGAEVSPMCPEYGVTYLSGRTQTAFALRARPSGTSPPFRTRSKRGPRNRASSVHDRPVRSRLDPEASLTLDRAMENQSHC